jgi:hypothetical protein
LKEGGGQRRLKHKEEMYTHKASHKLAAKVDEWAEGALQVLAMSA